MTIYIAGRITGNPDYKSDFESAGRALAEAGETVMNPAILPHGWGYEAYLRMTIAMLRECDVICLLPNWQDSNGAKKELIYAVNEGKRVMLFSDFRAGNGSIRLMGKKEAERFREMAEHSLRAHGSTGR